MPGQISGGELVVSVALAFAMGVIVTVLVLA